MMKTRTRALRTARRALAALAVTATTATGALAVGAGTSTAAPTAPATVTVARKAPALAASPALRKGTYEQQVQRWINVRRAHHGLRPLSYAACADRFAQRWGSHLAATGAFEHQSMQTILNRCNAYYAGETLGRGAISPKRLVYLWMHSPAHRHVLLSPYARRIGIGAYPDQYGRWVVAADFLRY